MSRRQTICVNSTPGDATRAAGEVAERLRAAGNTVTIGAEYTMPDGHKAGMLAVDLDIVDNFSATVAEKIDVTEDVLQVAEALGKMAEAVIALPQDTFGPSDDEAIEPVEVLPFAEELEHLAEPEKPPKNKGGRPKGSRNKPVSV